MDIRLPVSCLTFALVATLPATAGADATFFGPVPYLSAADAPAGFIDGPRFIEDFESGGIDPRIRLSSNNVQQPGGLTDSVDADDGAIDGSGTFGHSVFGGSIRVDFRQPWPTSAGIVWTAGQPSAVTFEAFAPDGTSLGVHGPFTLGDGSITGTTDEDRFFGVRDAEGIGAIQLHSSAVMEIDHVQFDVDVEPAILSTLHDGDAGVLLAAPSDAGTGEQIAFDLGTAHPHGLAFLGGHDVLFADFASPVLHRASLDAPGAATTITLAGRSTANGTLAVDPNGRHAISVGSSASGDGEAVVVDFGTTPPTETAIAGNLRVLPFVTAAIDFAPDGRAFVCHVDGVSVLHRPYTTIEFTMPFPAALQSPSMCRLTPDGRRLFVTRMLSETAPTVNGVHTTAAPFSASSVFVTMPAPADVQGLGPMAVSPDGRALLVGQQFLFPQAPNPPRARAFVLREPFDATIAYTEIALPPEAVGTNCLDGATPFDCPGYEHIEASADGSLAILTGNSNGVESGTAENAPAIFVANPFDDDARQTAAVPIQPPGHASGRGSGGVRFRPDRIFADGLDG